MSDEQKLARLMRDTIRATQGQTRTQQLGRSSIAVPLIDENGAALVDMPLDGLLSQVPDLGDAVAGHDADIIDIDESTALAAEDALDAIEWGEAISDEAHESQVDTHAVWEIVHELDEANNVISEEVEVSTRVPARVEGVRLVGQVGEWTDLGAHSRVTLAWEPVTTSAYGDPIELASYELRAGDVPAATVTGTEVEVLQVSGTTTSYTVRACSATGVWGDVSEPVEVTAEVSPVAAYQPTPPTLTTGAGMVVARWDGLYSVPSPPGAYGVVAERLAGSSWVVQGAQLTAAGTVTIPSEVGAVVQVRLRAVDQLGRTTGASDPVSITVAGVDVADVSEELTEWIKANAGAGITASATEPVEHKAGDLWFRLDASDRVVEVLISTGTDFVPHAFVGDSVLVAGSIKGRTLDVQDLWAHQAWLDILSTGILQADYLAPNVGEKLNISANEAVEIIVGRQAEQDDAIASAQDAATAAQSSADAAADQAGVAQGAAEQAAEEAAGARLVAEEATVQVGQIQAVFRVKSDHIAIATLEAEGTVPYEFRIYPTKAQLVQGARVISEWNGSQMIVNEAVLNRVQIGTKTTRGHQIEQAGSGRTIIRPIQ